LKDPAPADDAADAEPRPGHIRKPIGWSMIVIGVLVAVSAALVWRRDGTAGVLEILTHDLGLFGGILPRVLAGCLLGAFIAEILPHEKVSRSLGPKSGLTGLLIGTAFGAILPGGPFTAYPVASALLAVGADFGATIAMVVSWTLIGYGRAIAWELPIMGTDFTLWRIVSASLIIDIILWGSVAAVGFIAFRRGRPVLVASLREGTMDFINIVPRIALGVIGSGYIAAIIPQEVITGWLGPDSGWLGVLTATIAGAATPGGPVIGFSIGAVALKAGGGPPQVIAYVIAWALFAFQRLLLWEIPFMPARFVWFRAAVSLPFPFLAAAIAMAIGKP
jgi:uncharacterized membrane protein YraQ (UPF0718 family)